MSPTTLAAFSVGMRVEVKGRGAAGALRAERVKPDDDSYDDDDGGPSVEVVATVPDRYGDDPVARFTMGLSVKTRRDAT